MSAWSHAEAMQGWEAAEERESWARCDAEKWRELAQELATALGKFVGYTLSGDVYYFSPETHDLLARARKAGLEV